MLKYTFIHEIQIYQQCQIQGENIKPLVLLTSFTKISQTINN
jgi:hypothetical protein